MVSQQRHAAFQLSVVCLVLIVFAFLVPMIGASRAQGAFGLLALLAIGPFISRKLEGGVLGDERDRAIHLRSIQISGVIFGIIATVALWTTYSIHRHAGVISVELLPWAAWWGWIVFMLSQSVTMLVLYRLG